MLLKLLLKFFSCKACYPWNWNTTCNQEILSKSGLRLLRIRAKHPSWVLSSWPPSTAWRFPYAVFAGSLPLRQLEKSFLSDEANICAISFFFSLRIFSSLKAEVKKNDELATENEEKFWVGSRKWQSLQYLLLSWLCASYLDWTGAYFSWYLSLYVMPTYGVWCKMASCFICKKETGLG